MMIKNNKIIVALLLIYCQVESKASIYYMQLALIWPNTYCSTGSKICKQPIPQEFKVHGLWLYKRLKSLEDKPLKNCSGISFPKSEFETWNFSSPISSLWPNLDSRRKDITFWEREWNNYGVCTKMSPENYFYTGIKYAKKYRNIYRSLLQSGVISGSDQPYSREILQSEIAKVVGISPQIKCIKSNSRRNEVQLREIHICINIEGVAFNCKYSYFNCGPSKTPVIIPIDEIVSH